MSQLRLPSVTWTTAHRRCDELIVAVVELHEQAVKGWAHADKTGPTPIEDTVLAACEAVTEGLAVIHEIIKNTEGMTYGTQPGCRPTEPEAEADLGDGPGGNSAA